MSFLRKLSVATVPLIIGFVFAFAGFCQDPLWPAQDMPPDLTALYAARAAQALIYYQIGGTAIMVGIVGMLIIAIAFYRTAQPNAKK